VDILGYRIPVIYGNKLPYVGHGPSVDDAGAGLADVVRARITQDIEILLRERDVMASHAAAASAPPSLYIYIKF
jgi:hypothetical protein